MFKSIPAKRIFAYIIDMIIIYLISSMFISLEVLNPYLEKQNELAKDYEYNINEFVKNNEDFNLNDLTNSDFMIDYTYNSAYYGMYNTIISLVIIVLYFVVFQYYNKGKTIGKALMDIVIVDKNKKRASFIQIFLRALIINNILSNIIMLIMVRTLNKNVFLSAASYVSMIEVIILFTSIILLMFGKDYRLVHDFLAGTRVITTDEFNELNEIKEAKVSKVKKNKSKKE